MGEIRFLTHARIRRAARARIAAARLRATAPIPQDEGDTAVPENTATEQADS
jgi:hypothetical protein